MVWIIEYIIYAIILVVLIDNIYEFISHNNGHRKHGNKNNLIVQISQSQKPQNIIPNTMNKTPDDINNSNKALEMENELDKIFTSQTNQKNNITSHETQNSSLGHEIKTSNILELPNNL